MNSNENNNRSLLECFENIIENMYMQEIMRILPDMNWEKYSDMKCRQPQKNI